MTDNPRSARDWLAVINGLSAKDADGPPSGATAAAVLSPPADPDRDILRGPSSALSDRAVAPDRPDTIAGPASAVALDDLAGPCDRISADVEHVGELDAGGGVSRRWLALVAVLLVGVVALAVLTSLRVNALRANDARAATRAEVSAAASHEVLDLLTLSGASTAASQKQLTDLLSGATGNFRQQFATNEQALVTALVRKKVDQKGTVNAVGITSITGSRAMLTVNGQSTVSNTDAPKGQITYYRLQVTLQQVHGAWLVSDIGVIT